MAVLDEKNWEEDLVSEKSTKAKRKKLNEHELDELREHIDHISFNISKVYRHAKDRSRKEFNHAKNSFRRKFQHSYKNDKIGSKI
ncbi:MAG: hypothetical protein Q7U04_10925 [Bacteriovorax sp.]|nr:hypothetical protein [Bacteriovorax sp.]